MVNGKLLFQVTYGSHAHGTAHELSDQDQRFVYLSKSKFNTLHDHATDNFQIQHWELRNFMLNCIKGIPYELESLCAPKGAFLIPLDERLQDLLDRNVFASQQVVEKYLYFAAWKKRQYSNGLHHKAGYQSIRMLLECKHMILNNSGPRVFVGDDRDLLMGIKIGRTPKEEVNALYDKLLSEVNSLPNHLPNQPDVDAVWKTLQLMQTEA